MKKILFIALAFLATVGIAKAALWISTMEIAHYKRAPARGQNCGIS